MSFDGIDEVGVRLLGCMGQVLHEVSARNVSKGNVERAANQSWL